MAENIQIHNLTVLEDDIHDLTEEELANISGGGLWDGIAWYLGGKAIDYYLNHPFKASSSGYSLNGRNPSPY